MENSDQKFGFSGNKLDYFRESGEGSRTQSKPKSISDLGQSLAENIDFIRDSKSVIDRVESQELTLNYLCENPKSGRIMKGKGIIMENLGQNEEEKWVERDFLQLNSSDSSKREAKVEEDNNGDCNKKQKLETLKLSLALPDVSLSLSASNAAVPNRDFAPSRSVQSDDFTGTGTAASLSYSYSLPFSHNPSCSLTRNSTDQIWNCGEGTNGSVHSRFKPIGDGSVSLSNHWSRPLNRDGCNSLYRAAAAASENTNSSFFPSELPAKPMTADFKGLDSLEDVRKGERIVRDVILERVVRDIPVEGVELAREYLKYIMGAPERKDELGYLQNLLERRSDLTREMLLKCDRLQMEIMVAVKFGLREFVSGKLRLPVSELVEIFLFLRCRNVNCKASLPVDDCDCKICSTKKGFCSQCMCPVCYSYDCASNTCSWVGCDACSHWCHAACATDKKLIKPGPSFKGSSQMQFYCLGCGHASEMFGFVKDVFLCCAKDWGLETLKKELDCVRRIFKGSEDLKGKELYLKAAELITRLERRVISPSDACTVIIHFFSSKPDKEDMTDNVTASIGGKDLVASQVRRVNDAFSSPSGDVPRHSDLYNSGSVRQGVVSYDNFRYSAPKPHISSDRHLEDELSGKFSKKDTFEFDSSESIIRWKEEAAKMLQNRADEARKEMEEYRQLVQAKTEKLEQEYSEKLAKLCLQETEERRRKKLEELRILESSHSDYFKMKIRMQAEISGLVERMEATKQLWV